MNPATFPLAAEPAAASPCVRAEPTRAAEPSALLRREGGAPRGSATAASGCPCSPSPASAAVSAVAAASGGSLAWPCGALASSAEMLGRVRFISWGGGGGGQEVQQAATPKQVYAIAQWICKHVFASSSCEQSNATCFQTACLASYVYSQS